MNSENSNSTKTLNYIREREKYLQRLQVFPQLLKILKTLNQILHTVPPDAPSFLRTTKVGQDFVSLEWKAPSHDGGSKITGYMVEKCEETSDKWMKVKSLKPYDTTLKVTDLKENVGYFFAVSAENEAGMSKPCETDSPVTPKRPAGLFLQNNLNRI